jgi:hypothetical protein
MHRLFGLVPLLSTTIAHAADEAPRQSIGRSGVTAVWMLANVSYAGMRAQNHPSKGWRVVAFIFGLPGSLLSFFVIQEGSGTAYGVHLPKRRPRDDEPSPPAP